MEHTLVTHLLYSSNDELLEREARRMNYFLVLNSEKYQMPCVKDGKSHEWKIEAEVIRKDSEEILLGENELPACLVIRRKSKFPWRNYVSPDNQEIWRKYYHPGDEFTMSRNLVLLIPNKSLAIDLRDPLINKYPSLKDSLRNAGYVLLKKPYDSVWPLFENYEFLQSDPLHEETFQPWEVSFLDKDLHYLMRNRKRIPSFDRRAYQIIDELTRGIVDTSNVSTDDLTYHFVTYPLMIKKEEDVYAGQEEEIARGLRKVFDVSAKQAVNGGIEKIFLHLPPSHALGMRSIVKTPRGLRHIPMIDFQGVFHFSDEKATMERELRSHGYLPGMLVDSGKSAHFYGFGLLAEKKWSEFMDELDRFYLADQKFVSIQRESGSTTLRITPVNAKLYQPMFYQRIR